jgi:ribosomal protein S8E
MAQNASDSVVQITAALQRYNTAINSVGNSSRGLASAVSSFKETVESTSSALMSSEVSFTKWTKTVDDSSKILKLGALFALTGLPKTRAVVFGLIEAGRLLVNAVLESNDAQLNTYDAVAKLGIGIGSSVEGFTKISNEAGFWTKNNIGLLKSYEKLGTGLTNLGDTTNIGAQEFGKIAKTGDGVVSEFMRLGVSQSDLVNLQADYVSMTQMLGTKYQKNDEKLRDESRAYVTSLVGLSRLTGENIADLSARIAEQARDVQFSMRLRMLRKTEQGKLLADKYQEAEVIAQSFLGPDVAKGVRDFLATGTATTKEGEALLAKTNGQIVQWKADLDAGRITQYEFMQKIAKSSLTYEEKNKKALMQSKEFREKTNTSVQALNGAERLIRMQSMESIKAELELYKKGEKAGEKVDDALKDVQIANFEAAQQTGIAKDKLIGVIQEPVNGALRKLGDLVKQTAIGTIRLGAWLLGLDSSKIDEALVALGDTSQIKGYLDVLNKSIKETDNQIQAQKAFADIQKDNEKKLQDAIKRKKELEGKISQAGTSQEKTRLSGELASVDAEAKTYQDKIKESKQQEKEKFGQTSEELQQKREYLIKRKTVAEGQKTESEKAETRKAETYKTYLSGKGTEYERWTKINPNFQEKVLAMAQKYFEMTGNKLNITSSYRSEEEQKDMYDEWRKAGGRYPWEKNPNPKVWTEKYGWLYMPSASPGGHGAGTAVDINRDQLDWLEKNGYLDDFGLRRHYPIENDPVHVMPKAKDGGVFGPGWLEMHGTEAKVGMKGNTIPIELKQSGGMNDFSNMRGSITKPKIYSPNAPVKSKSDEFAGVLLEKIDDLNRKISESNSIYSDIKLYISN